MLIELINPKDYKMAIIIIESALKTDGKHSGIDSLDWKYIWLVGGTVKGKKLALKNLKKAEIEFEFKSKKLDFWKIEPLRKALNVN